jgi:hypothetical protein
VLLPGEEDWPSCRGKNKAGPLAYAVTSLHDHLPKSNRALWIWGDRLLDAAKGGAGREVQTIPKDVVINNWHYSTAVPTAVQFAIEGFPVISCPWSNGNVALGRLELIRNVRLVDAYYGRDVQRMRATRRRASSGCSRRSAGAASSSDYSVFKYSSRAAFCSSGRLVPKSSPRWPMLLLPGCDVS